VARRRRQQAEIVEQSLCRHRPAFFLGELLDLDQIRLDVADARLRIAFHRHTEVEAIGARLVHADRQPAAELWRWRLSLGEYGARREQRNGGQGEKVAAIEIGHSYY